MTSRLLLLSSNHGFSGSTDSPVPVCRMLTMNKLLVSPRKVSEQDALERCGVRITAKEPDHVLPRIDGRYVEISYSILVPFTAIYLSDAIRLEHVSNESLYPGPFGNNSSGSLQTNTFRQMVIQPISAVITLHPDNRMDMGLVERISDAPAGYLATRHVAPNFPAFDESVQMVANGIKELPIFLPPLTWIV